MYGQSRMRTRFLLMIALVASMMTQAGMTNAQQIPQPSAVLFKNAKVFDGKSDKLSGLTSVLIVGNKVSKIAVDFPASDNATVIDAGGRTLLPGLIDNHVHLFMNGSTQEEVLRSYDKPEKLNEVTAKQAEKMLMRGFTAVRDVGGPVFEVKKWIDEGKTIGPRIYPSGAMISQTSGHGDTRLPNEKSRRFFGTPSKGEVLGVNFIADGRADVLTAVRENLRFGASQIKVMAGGGAATVYDPLDVTQYTLDELRAAVEAADDWGTYVTVHAYTPKAVRRAVEAGVLCVEHGQLLDEETIRFLGEKGIWLSLQALDPAPPSASPLNKAKKQLVVDGTDLAYRMAKKYKLKLAWGTDLMFDPKWADNQSKDILKLEQWFTPFEAIRMITHDNAELLALSGKRNPYPGKLGVIEEGALADILLVDGDPLVELKLLSDPEKNLLVIMKDGKVYKNSVK
jgi:imidazolonepropionase-like amidohydrolase